MILNHFKIISLTFIHTLNTRTVHQSHHKIIKVLEKHIQVKANNTLCNTPFRVCYLLFYNTFYIPLVTFPTLPVHI